jgi:uncharacterized membrane protein
MMTNQQLKVSIAWILNIGIVLSLGLVILGGLTLLYRHGGQPIDTMILQPAQITLNPFLIWHTALTLSPISLIELGLLALVGTQVLRILLLLIYYTVTRDIWFTAFSLFILLMMLASFFMR